MSEPLTTCGPTCDKRHTVDEPHNRNLETPAGGRAPEGPASADPVREVAAAPPAGAAREQNEPPTPAAEPPPQ